MVDSGPRSRRLAFKFLLYFLRLFCAASSYGSSFELQDKRDSSTSQDFILKQKLIMSEHNCLAVLTYLRRNLSVTLGIFTISTSRRESIRPLSHQISEMPHMHF